MIAETRDDVLDDIYDELDRLHQFVEWSEVAAPSKLQGIRTVMIRLNTYLAEYTQLPFENAKEAQH